jgi:hypothetical protein
MHNVSDLRSTIVPKSDQLNADQLLGGPMTITVSEVRLGSSDEQPISIHYENDAGRPFKPCKTMRKVLLFAWGQDGNAWPGRSMTLYNDPAVKFGGEKVGGIRISHLTDIDRPLEVSLTATKGKKALHTIDVLERGPDLDDVLAAIAAAGNKAQMNAAKVLAGKLTSQADVAAAVAAYGARVAALKAQAAPAPAKTYAQWVDDIDNAADVDAANAVLESARDALTPTEFEQLTEAHRIAWTA